MPDDEFLNRMTGNPGATGDKLKEILNSNAGGEAGKLHNKLANLWAAAETPKQGESVERMKARNAALRLAKGAKTRRPDDPGVQAQAKPKRRTKRRKRKTGAKKPIRQDQMVQEKQP